MSRRTTLTVTLALGLALVGGVGAARAADGTRGEAMTTIRSIDPDQHLVVLDDGTQLLATDPAVFDRVHEGDVVKVRFSEEGGRYVIDSIEPAPTAAPAASPALRAPSPYDQMHTGEGLTSGPQPSKNPAGAGGVEFGGGPHDGLQDEPEAP